MADGQQVEVYSPSGALGTIPSNQLQQALGEGYKPRSAYVEAVHPETKQTGLIPKDQWDDAQKEGFRPTQREQVYQLPNAAMQSKYQLLSRAPGLTRDTGRYPRSLDIPGDQAVEQAKGMASAMLGVPSPSYVTPQQAATGVGTGLLAGSAIVAPVPTAMGLLGSQAGGEVTGGISKLTGASPAAQELWRGAGELGGGLVGGEAGTRLYSGNLGELASSAKAQVMKLFKASPARVSELADYFPARLDAMNAREQAFDRLRTFEKSMYPDEIIADKPTNVRDVRLAAQDAVKELRQFGPVPRPALTVSKLPVPEIPTEQLQQIQNEAAMGKLSQDLEPLAQASDAVPFRDAQRYRTLIEEYISKNEPPGNVYESLKKISGSLTDAMKETASAHGVLGRVEIAEKMHAQRVADFMDRDAPLRPFRGSQLDSKEGLQQFLTQVNDKNVLSALEKYGIDTSRIRKMIAPSDAQIAKNVGDAARLHIQGRQNLDQLARDERMAVVRKAVLAGLGGLSGVGGLTYWLARGRHQ